RLNVIELDIPPLRERKDDLPLLINYFLKLYSKKLSKKIRGIDKEAIDILMEYPWPGNIRELMNVLEQIVVINAGGYIGKKQLPSSILAGFERQSNFWHIKDHPLDLSVAVKELEEENIKRALLTSKNNKSKAARLLNIPRATLYHKMEEYKLFKRK
ncbi:MAG: helix-turn-helix domain-containing protein, partial [Clostridiaceae bacterium]|nr:helix-turn-helix domain-containing protein [Clostridiaceae bacterium]